MAEERVNIGNIKTTIGLAKNKVLSDVLDDYVEEAAIIDDIEDATSNTVILGAKATKDAIDSKASNLAIPTNVSDLNNDVPYLVASDIANKVDKVTGKGLSTEDYTTSEKTKLAGIDVGANNYSHPTYTSKTKALYKVAVDSTGHISDTTAVSKSDITALGIPAQDTTYNNATSSADGLMSSSDKAKLDNIEAQANKTIVDSALSSSSTNPVQNKVVNGLATRISALETNSLSIQIIASGEDLPQQGSVNKLYFIQSSSSSTGNVYDEYAWTGSSYELVGQSELDLTGYVQISDLKNHISGEIVTSGANAGDINLIFS